MKNQKNIKQKNKYVKKFKNLDIKKLQKQIWS
ncbi:Hypothetical Protein SLY_0445 [Strawberry lethal yellows phytoplasma (CPA) str. NZSb11]|uniref:Uncharacterized protein n=1 Tax=Strawberry lethal yellows phytoplasma (CPA) str. NZSb11 TaxID=980422 RepID=R4RM05_PHYAS|nr:Hypothetical Protein SLY_0445 [Strawberry lethal yellows phytoplasma (CPA) str. NZSb11]